MSKPACIINPISPDELLGFNAQGCLMAFEETDGIHSGYMVPDLRDHLCCICGKEWELSGPSFQRHVRVRDQENWSPVAYAHRSCFQGHRNILEGELWLSVLARAAGRGTFKLAPISSRYWSPDDAHATDWYIVKFDNTPARLMVGKRKRVWSITLTDANVLEGDWILTDTSRTRNTCRYRNRNDILMHAETREEVVAYVTEMVQKFILPAPAATPS